MNAASNREGPLSRREACIAAAIFALLGAAVAWLVMNRPGRPGDFLYWYTAANAFLDGRNPYDVIPAIDPKRFVTPFFYPLPAVLLTIPFARLPYAVAGAFFVGISSGLLAWALARHAGHRLLAFGSAPFLVAAASGVWSPIVMAGALLPAVGFVAAVKPNLGIASALYRPSRGLIVGSLVLLIASVAARPTWPAEWLRVVGQVHSRVIPIFTPAGPLLLLAATRWRRPEARLLLGYACVPQAPWFYDQLILWLIPATARQTASYTVLSQLMLMVWLLLDGFRWPHGTWVITAALYLPALAMVMLRPNEAAAPTRVAPTPIPA